MNDNKRSTNKRNYKGKASNVPKKAGKVTQETKKGTNSYRTNDTSVSSGGLRTSTGQLSSDGRHNDPNWYFLDRELAEQAASFSITGFNGVPMDITMGDKSADSWKYIYNKLYVNPICIVNMNPSPGNTQSIQRGINMAALATYAKLSSRNAKTTGYAPQDLTMLMLAIGEIISMMEHLRRVFGVYFTYNQRNRTMPVNIIQSMGVDFDDLNDKYADYRMKFNSLVTALNQIPFPSNIAYLYKCADLYQHVYADSDSSMAQLIITKPESTWILDEAYDDQGSGLRTKTCPVYNSSTPSNSSMNTWFAIVEEQINALLTSSTFNFIYSDVLNLRDLDNVSLFYMDYLNEGYIVVPEYNQNFLLQLHNATIVGNPVEVASPNYEETTYNDVRCSVNKNTIVYGPRFQKQQMIPFDTIVDFPTPTASVEDRIEATRYTVAMSTYNLAGDGLIGIDNLPDHYIVKLSWIKFDASGNISRENIGVQFWRSDDVTPGIAVYFAAFNTIDWGPIFYIQTPNAEAGENVFDMMPTTDLNYYTTLNDDWFSRVNDLAFQALFTLR